MFPVTPEYIYHIQMKQIFYLVQHGFSAEYVHAMPIEKRQAYLNMFIDANTPDENSNH